MATTARTTLAVVAVVSLIPSGSSAPADNNLVAAQIFEYFRGIPWVATSAEPTACSALSCGPPAFQFACPEECDSTFDDDDYLVDHSSYMLQAFGKTCSQMVENLGLNGCMADERAHLYCPVTCPAPTPYPTMQPTTGKPSVSPTVSPTHAPTTPAPTSAPTTSIPTASPTTSAPTLSPTTGAPTASPTTCQDHYDLLASGDRPSSIGTDWETICGCVGHNGFGQSSGCPAWGKNEWCEGLGFHDAKKSPADCSVASGITIIDGRCYTCPASLA